jgi:hypothetical protein
MEKETSKEEIYETAKGVHVSLDRRLRMLLRKPFLSEEEEIEMKVLKKKKLFYKDIIEGFKEEQ